MKLLAAHLLLALFTTTAQAAPRVLVLVEAPASPPTGPSDVEVVAVTNSPAANAKEDLVEAARAKCKQASSQALNMQSGQALITFEQAIDIYARGMPKLTSYQEVTKCLLDYAAAAVDSGASAKASEVLRRALNLQPDLAPNRSSYSPDVFKTLERARAQLNSMSRGSLTVVGDPAGANVQLDGKSVGVLPMSLSSVVAGEHWLLVTGIGRAPFTARVIIEPRKLTRLDVFLTSSESGAVERDMAALMWQQAHAPVAAFATQRGLEGIVVLREQERATTWRLFDTRTGKISESKRSDTPANALTQALALLPKPQPLPPRRGTASAPVVTAAPLKSTGTHVVLAMLPLGIGQFLERRPVPAALLLSSQVLLLGANIAMFYVANSYALPNGEFRDPNRVKALSLAINISFGLLAADVIAGAIDGIVHRDQPR